MNALESLALPLDIRARLRQDYAPHTDRHFAPCPGEDGTDVAAAVDAGAWSVFPIFSGPDQLAGPLLTPEGCRYDDHWCVTLDGGSVTFCHGAARFPDRMYAAYNERVPDLWRQTRGAWLTVEGPRWRTLCAILGTTDAVYEGLLFDDAWLPGAAEEADPQRSLARACDLLCAVDPHPDTRAYCAALLGQPPEACRTTAAPTSSPRRSSTSRGIPGAPGWPSSRRRSRCATRRRRSPASRRRCRSPSATTSRSPPSSGRCGSSTSRPGRTRIGRRCRSEAECALRRRQDGGGGHGGGVIQPSADKIEGLLGEGVPLVLDLLAKLLGVNVASGVRGVLDKARDWVENAIIKLAKRFLAMFKVGGAGEGAQAEEGAVDSLPVAVVGPSTPSWAFRAYGGSEEVGTATRGSRPPTRDGRSTPAYGYAGNT